MEKYDYLIVGAGLFGAVFAHEAKRVGKHCLVIDKRNHRGGNIYCEDIEGIHVHKYGAHIFHTDNKEVWDYVNSFVEFNRYTNSPLAYFDGKLYNLPFNMNTFYQLWGVKTPAEAKAKIEEQRKEFDHIATPANLEEQALKLCGKDIYHRLIKGYTEKQWGRSAKELPAFIIKRIPFRFIYDNNYFNDSYQGIPKGGYNALIDALLEGTEVIDKRNHRGGNIYCEDIEGIHVHKYGAHIFHTDNKEVWDYVNSFVEFNRYTNSPLAYFDGKLYNLPFNMNTFYQLWGVKTPAEAKAKIEEQRKEFDHIATPANLEEQALKLCGKDIYHRLIKGYTEKQWGRSAKELPAFIIKRIPFRFIYDNNYFNDSYQGIPKGGYNALIDALLEGTEVRLNTNYFSNRNELDALADNILFTGCIDQFFDYQCGHLEYRSLRFEHKQLETEDFQGNAVVNYTEREVPYTRIIEHKHFEFGTQPTTVITYEYPDDFAPGKEPYYPINDKRNTEMMSQYKKLASERKDVLFGGRLAQYAYADMDDTVAAALALCKKTFK